VKLRRRNEKAPSPRQQQCPKFLRLAGITVEVFYSLWREDGSVVCSAICQWSESRRTHNHTLLSHLRLLGSLSVASYDSQGWRWKYSTLSDERTGLWFVVQSVSGQSRGGLKPIHDCLIWGYWAPFPSPLTTRRDYGGVFLPASTRGREVDFAQGVHVVLDTTVRTSERTVPHTATLSPKLHPGHGMHPHRHFSLRYYLFWLTNFRLLSIWTWGWIWS
jgi:hypothetical protein